MVSELQGVGSLLAGLITAEAALVAVRLAVVILAVFLVHESVRRTTQRWMSAVTASTVESHSSGSPMRGLLIMALALMRGGIALGVALGAGYLISLVMLAANSAGSLIAASFLQAFASVYVIRLVLEIFLQPNHGAARPVPLDDTLATHWQRRLMRLAQFGAYGVLLVAPAIAQAAQATGHLVKALVIVGVAWGLLRVLRDLKGPVRQWLTRRVKAKRGSVLRPVLGVLAPVWHWLVGGYVLAMAALGLIAPGATMSAALTASGLSIALGLAAGFLGHWLSVLARSELPIPAHLSSRFSMLRVRLGVWLPRLAAVGHWLIVLAVVGALLEIWGVADVAQWLASDSGQALTGALFGVIGIVLVALVAWLFSVSWIEDRLNPETGHGAPGAREKTLLSLFRNAIAIAIITLGGMVALAEIGINIGPLIAGAGVIGLAIGFGAQKLVQDIITGVFIQLEDAIHTDDFVTAGGISGTVERLSIRSLGLRDLSGTLHVVPFSSVDTVSNYTRDFGYHLGEYGVAYRENIGEVVEHLNVAYERLCANGDISGEVTGPLEVDGVTALADSAVNVRVRIRTTPGMQWAVGRAYNRTVKEVFDEVGIEIPFPHMTLYFGEDKQGMAPPAHIALEDKSNQEK